MRFGTVDTFFGLNAADLRLGRNVANHEFLKALLTHGTYQAYHFFLPDLQHLEVFRQRLALLIPDQALARRVHATVQVALGESLQDHDFTVFHQSDFTRLLPYLAPFRDKHARAPFPITGVTHSLNTSIMPLRYLQLGLADLKPYDAIVCTSRAGMQVVQKSFDQMAGRLWAQRGWRLNLNAQLAHIPLGIDDARFAFTPSRQPVPGRPTQKQARQALHLPLEGGLLLSLGRLSARTKMDLHPLIHGLAERWRSKRLSQVRLVIAGGAEPGELASLKQLLAELKVLDRVFFVADFDETQKTQLFAAADVFLSPSDNLQETFGLSVVEAMAAGVPPIVSDFDGYQELVLHHQTGVRVPTLWSPPLDAFVDLEVINPSLHPFYLAQTFVVDLDATLAAIERLFADEAWRRSLGQAAQLHAEQYRWSNVIPRYEALWKELKQQAAAAAPTAHPLAHPLFMDSADIFSHYPTALLEARQTLELTDRGRMCAQGSPLPAAHKDFALLLHPPLLMAVLETLLSGPQSVESLRVVGTRLETTPGFVDHHVLWALKYGLLRLQTPPAIVSPPFPTQTP